MRNPMRLLLGAAVLAAFAGGAAAPHARAATTLCVGGSGGCYQTLQGAFDAAHDGDTIRIAPGTFAGGATVDASVDIVGRSAAGSTFPEARTVPSAPR
jgi:hypothetical protein